MLQTITAKVSAGVLHKADRLFTNQLEDVLVELLQNARRANATRIDVTAIAARNAGTHLRIHDNGHGIADFATLLSLGESGWNAEVCATEDPAGMGLWSLVHSGVTIQSCGKKAVITPAAFRGLETVTIEPDEENIAGTVLSFDRPEDPSRVRKAVEDAARYGVTDVYLNGVLVPLKDFLADALFVKRVKGVRIGVYQGRPYREPLINFYGKTLSDVEIAVLTNVLPDVKNALAAHHLHARLDVLETGSLHLKLPDRNAVVHDECFYDIQREARLALFEWLAQQPSHVAPFALYEEARQLGVPLSEATPYLEAFAVQATSSDYYGEFLPDGHGANLLVSVSDLDGYALVVDEATDNSPEFLDDSLLTLAIAHKYDLAELPLIPVKVSHGYEGYSWYPKLPRYTNVAVIATGIGETRGTVNIVESIKLRCDLVLPGSTEAENLEWDIPFAAESGEFRGEDFFLYVTKDSPWAKHETGPFDLLDAATFVGFSYHDEGDTYDTQLSDFEEWVGRDFTRILCGPLEAARQAIRKAIESYELRTALENANLSEIRLIREGPNEWNIAWVSAAAAA